MEKRGKGTEPKREVDFKGIRGTQVTAGIIFKLLLLNGLRRMKGSGLVALSLGPQGSPEMWVTHAQRTCKLPGPVLRPRPQDTVSALQESTVQWGRQTWD